MGHHWLYPRPRPVGWMGFWMLVHCQRGDPTCLSSTHSPSLPSTSASGSRRCCNKGQRYMPTGVGSYFCNSVPVVFRCASCCIRHRKAPWHASRIVTTPQNALHRISRSPAENREGVDIWLMIRTPCTPVITSSLRFKLAQRASNRPTACILWSPRPITG